MDSNDTEMKKTPVGIFITDNKEKMDCGVFPVPWCGDADAFNFIWPDMRVNIEEEPDFMETICDPGEVQSVLIAGKFEDYSFMERFTGLRQLYIYDGPGLEDINFLKGLIDLRYLLIRGADIQDIGPVAELIKKQCEYRKKMEEEHDALWFLSGLKCLSIQRSNVRDLSPFGGIHTYLADLDMSFNQIESLEPLMNISVTNLLLQENQIRDIRCLLDRHAERFFFFRTLTLSDNPIQTKLTEKEFEWIRTCRRWHLPSECYQHLPEK